MTSLTDQLKAQHPFIPPGWLADLEPRQTRAPAGYHSHKLVAAGLARILADAQIKYQHGALVGTQVSALTTCYRVIAEKVPVYYIDERFARAVASTDLPADFMISELKWPRDACVFAFPEQFMDDYLGTKTCYVWCARACGDSAPPSWYSGPTTVTSAGPTENPRAKVSWFYFHSQEGQMAAGSAAYFTDEPAAGVAKHPYVEYSNAGRDMARQNQDQLQRLTNLVFKLLLVYTTRPSFVDPGESGSQVASRPGQSRPNGPAEPVFIGRGYQAVRPASGTHASPAMHVRRRHFAYVAVGKRGAPDFIRSASLPRLADGEIDWTRVEPDKREAFLRCHRREWIDTILIGGNGK